MRDRNKIIAIINLITAICFFLAALIGKNYVYIPIGCCFIVLAVANGKTDKSKNNINEGNE